MYIYIYIISVANRLQLHIVSYFEIWKVPLVVLWKTVPIWVTKIVMDGARVETWYVVDGHWPFEILQ